MTFHLYAVRFGAPAIATLAEVLGVSREGDPFARATVLVPDNLTGVIARRSLGRVGAYANVSFVTPARLAANIVGGEVRTLTPVMLAAGVRAALAEETRGMFAPVAGHEATELALTNACRSLAAADAQTIAELAAQGSGRTKAVVGLHRRVMARVADVDDEWQLARRARDIVASPGFGAVEHGPVIAFLIDELAPAYAALLEALGERTFVVSLVGHAGHDDADRPLAWWSARFDAPVAPAPLPLVDPAVELQVFTTTDSDDEIRYVVRDLLRRAEAGAPFARMAIVYPASDPYQRLVHEHLTGAGIEHHAPAVRTLADLSVGRVVNALFDLRRSGWSRAAVIDLCHMLANDERPAVAWDNISRAAGVVGGLADWQTKLTHFAARAVAPDNDDLVASAAALGTFVDELAARFARGEECHRWADLAVWAHDTVAWLTADVSRWPADEAAARDVALSVIDEHASLDAIDHHASLGALERSLATTLAVPAARVGVLGVGVQVYPLSQARALDADVVFVVGMAEGLCPGLVREDTLLPDADRRLARYGELPLSLSRTHDQHRALRAALASARQACVVGFPRGDHRGGRVRVASRWLLDMIQERTGSRVSSREVARRHDALVTHVPSFAAGMRAATTALHTPERRLQLLAASPTASVGEHPCAPAALQRGLAAVAARASAAFTEWDGNLASCTIEGPTLGKVMSPTTLEMWAACPRSYFFKKVLHLNEREDPELVQQVSPLDRGSALHYALEHFVRGVVAQPVAPTMQWNTADRQQLQDFATIAFDELWARGAVGSAVRWGFDQTHLRRILDNFLAEDNAFRAGFGSTPVETELRFGMGDAAPVSFALADGRQVLFRGAIDRVDRTAVGYMAIDYKSGKADKYKELDSDPVMRGRGLQLPIYALAVEERFATSDVAAAYWFLESNGRRAVPLNAETRARFTAVLTDIVDGIDAGVFVANSGDEETFWQSFANCASCKFASVCSGTQGNEWTVKSEHADASTPLGRYVALTNGPNGADEGTGTPGDEEQR